ncbi:MAG: ABC transporter substrate-binding protein [Bacteroidales bacterium]|nr:ABC transporter substrate-binding protein [Bacteroidales bacterium]
MKFSFRYYFILSFLAFVLCSCTSENRNAGKKVFRYNEAANINSLDPAYAKDQAMIWADVQLYNGLVQMDNKLNIMPSIAKSWEVSNDGLEYTFHLRDDVYFHPHQLFKNGKRRVVAADFVYSLNRIVDAKTMSPGAVFFENVEQINGKYSFFAPNDTTFVVRLKQAFSPFLGILTMPYASVVPKEIVNHYKEDFRKHPIGTGPFKFKMWKENVKLVLVKNEDYFEKDSLGKRLPYLDAVAISFIVDKQSVFLEFVKGNIDFISGIDPNYKDEILTRSGKLQPKYKDKINLITQPYLNTEYLGFKMDVNDEKNPLKDKRVRQAINYGFSREKMIKYMRNNIGYPGEYGIIPVGLAGFDSTVNSYEYNPEKSKRLLAEAGYPNGEGMQEITLSTTATYLDLCKYIQQQLGLLGIKVKIDVNPPAALREHIAQGKTQWFRGSWIADYPDAENYLSLFYSKNHCPKGSNYTHFSSKEFDKLYEKAILETDYEKRIALYKKMNDIIIEESPIVVLYYDQVLRFVQKNISGFESNPLNLLILKNVNKD